MARYSYVFELAVEIFVPYIPRYVYRIMNRCFSYIVSQNMNDGVKMVGQISKVHIINLITCNGKILNNSVYVWTDITCKS